MQPDKPRIGRLLACLLYESLVIFSLLLVGFWIPQSLILATGLKLPGNVLLLHIVLLLLLYFLWFWLNGGQTLAMKTWKLRLISTEGSYLRPGQALVRYLAAWGSLLLFGVGFLWAFFDPQRRFLHDRVAGTRIIGITSGNNSLPST